MSQLRAFVRTLRPAPPADPVVRFETAMGEQLQVDWGEFRKGSAPLHAFCATLGFSRASYVEFVSNMKVETLIACHVRAVGHHVRAGHDADGGPVGSAAASRTHRAHRR
jgi:transposase